MKSFFLFLAALTLLHYSKAQDTTQYIIPNRVNSAIQRQKPYVVLISADGFRYDLADKYNAPFLKKMRNQGVKAVSMEPCYPTLTFPNHYSIATGLYPAHHGLVGNHFYDPQFKQFYSIRDRKAVEDPKWYGGIPLWVLAEKQHLLSASFYWVGSESHIDGTDPTYYYKYNTAIPMDRRIQIFKNWLQLHEARRPHLITFYFPQVDHAEHLYGVESPKVADAVRLIDRSVKKMVEIAHTLQLPVNFIFVSDHGMLDVDTTHTLRLPAIDTTQFIIVNEGALVHIYTKNRNKRVLRKIYKKLVNHAKNYKVYKAKNTPRRWHYNRKQDHFHRIGAILLVSDTPYVFGKSVPGRHGFDNRLQEMQATFYAWGPAFKSHQTIGNFENIHIYPLIAHILGLKITHRIDGKLETLKGILKEGKQLSP